MATYYIFSSSHGTSLGIAAKLRIPRSEWCHIGRRTDLHGVDRPYVLKARSHIHNPFRVEIEEQLKARHATVKDLDF